MKNWIYGVMLLVLSSCSAEKKGLVLEGHIVGMADDELVISLQTGRFESEPVDTVKVTGGKFRYENPAVVTGSYSFVFTNAQIGFGGILEPVKMTISGDVKDADRGWLPVEFEGGRNNAFVKEFDALRTDLLKEPRFAAYAGCLERLRASKSKEEADAIREEMEKLEPAFNAELFPKEQEMFRKNTDLYAIQTQVGYRFGQYPDVLVGICRQIPDSLKYTYLWKEIQREIDAYDATRPGKIAPDFALYTPDSTALSLSDLRGKYVLLDFWASWCAPCRASFPKLKELYKIYKPKGFEILSITNDSNHEQWKKAIEQDQTPWLHVADEFPGRGTARVISMYGFHSLPSTMLIGPDGKIIATLKGEEEIEARLAQIFK